MPAGGRGIRAVLNNSAIEHLLTDESGPFGQDLQHRGEVGAQSAKYHAPVSPVGSSDHPSGQLRSDLGWELGKDGEGLYVDVGVAEGSPALEYALAQELGARPHIIRSHGDYPLRSRTGQVFGKEVHHPGNPPHPYLRPALDDMR